MRRRDISGKTLEDIGIVVLLIALLIAAIVCGVSEDVLLTENLIMTIFTFFAVAMAAFRVSSFAIVTAILQTVGFLALKIWMVSNNQEQLSTVSFFWIVIPGLAVTGMLLFVKGVNRLQLDNNILSKQVEELIMIDPLTGLYNLRCLYMDMQTQISYAERNDKKICLMILRPRYKKELKRVLSKTQYENLIVKLSKYVYDTVRLEDRVYSLDNDGTLGLVLTTDKNGANNIEKRIREKIDSEQAFCGIAEKPIRMVIQLGCLEYKSEYNRDAIMFKGLVEEELAYDL